MSDDPTTSLPYERKNEHNRKCFPFRGLVFGKIRAYYDVSLAGKQKNTECYVWLVYGI